MPRRVQDILPGDRRSIRNIPIDGREFSSTKEATKESVKDNAKESKIRLHRVAEEKPSKHFAVTPPPGKYRERPLNRTKWFFIAMGIIVVIAGIGFVASSYYSKATFTITPKSLPLVVNGTYVAQASTGDGILTYSLVTLKNSASTTIPAVDGPVTTTKAQGAIILYNSYSASPVRLIAGTRIADNAGRVYKLGSSVLIPGYKKTGSTIVPGSLKATMVASEAGQSYNITKNGFTDILKMVAYKGTARYETIYAKLNSDITGGWIGTKKSISPSIMASTTAKLKADITATMTTQMLDEIPEGYTLMDKNQIITFKEPVISGDLPKSAIVSISGTMTGILFKQSDLVDKFSGNKSESTFGKYGYTTSGFDSMQIDLVNIKDFSPEKKGSLILKAKGDIRLIGTIPVDEIRSKLLGGRLNETQELFRIYNAVIDNASGELVPPWSKIPTDPDRISIIVRNPW